MVDESRQDSSSRVAAGLVTPITGARLAISWRWRDYFTEADRMYRSIERSCGTSFWYVAPAERVFTCHEESERFQERWCSDSGQATQLENGLQLNPLEPVRMALGGSWFGGLEMAPAARLDTPKFLDVTRAMHHEQGRLYEVNLDCDGDVVPVSSGIRIPSLGIAARWLVLCQGVAARKNSWFEHLPLHPARGDILEIQSRTAAFDRVLHHHAWAVPLGGRRYLVGATYDRHCLDTQVDHQTALQFRHVLYERWQEMTGENGSDHTDFLVQHRAAIRPASYDRHPLVGRHNQVQNIYCLNGLGSKGSLMAPALANHLLDSMLLGLEIDPALQWNRRVSH
jgi:glycine/D-amino acid oxidase-like deaminating enzyme